MRTLANALAILLIFIGVIWFLQGIGTLPGSFMTGQRQWAVAGLASFVVGVGLGLYLRRRR